MNLLQLLLGSLTSNDSLNSVSKKTGVSSKLTSKLLLLAVPILLKQLTKNASNKEGANSLLGALTQHTSKESVVQQLANADTTDGAKIIAHILGNNQKSVINDLAKQSGATTAEVNSILNNIAPALLNSLGTVTNTVNSKKQSGVDLSDGLDLSDIMGLLGNNSNSSSATDLLGSLLGGNNKKNNELDLLNSLLGNKKSNGNELLSLLSALSK